MSPSIDIVGLGVSTVDLVYLVDHFPVGDEIQRALDMTIQGGGPVATAVAASARLGARTAMLDVVGDDWRGTFIRQEFEVAGVLTSRLRVAKDTTSAMATVLVRKNDGARAIVYTPGTTPELSPADLDRSEIESAGFLHVNGRHWEACLQACRWARQAGARVSFDGGAHRYREEMRQLVPLSNVCIAARDFAERYTRETEIPLQAAQLLAEGPELVVITDGTRGSWIYPRETASFHQPAFSVQVVDTTGCGDAYHGAFLFGLSRGLGVQAAARLASVTAALNAMHLGGRRGLPALHQVEAFLEQQA